VAVLWPGHDAIDVRDIARKMPLRPRGAWETGGEMDRGKADGERVGGDGGGGGSKDVGSSGSGGDAGGASGGGAGNGSGGRYKGEGKSASRGEDGRGEHGAASAGAGGAEAGQGYTFIAIDATWNCARKMLRRLPSHLPLVSVPPEAFSSGYKVDPAPSSAPAPAPLVTAATPSTSAPSPAPPTAPVPSLLAPVRKYKGHPDGRCSTFEAVVALLRTLGHPRGECEALLDNVRATVDAVKAGGGPQQGPGFKESRGLGFKGFRAI
jgi:hypothetical protein